MNYLEAIHKYRNQAIVRTEEIGGVSLSIKEIPYCTMKEAPCFEGYRDKCPNFKRLEIEVTRND